MANDCESENYVAGMWRIFRPSTPVPALRNIILAATYAQRCCIQHLWAHARRGFVEVLKSLGLNPKKLPANPPAKARRALVALQHIRTLYAIERRPERIPRESAHGVPHPRYR